MQGHESIAVPDDACCSLLQAIIGMFFQDGLTGSAWGDWSLYTASPLRARESKVARNFFGGETTSYTSFDPATELGVQDPIGFWDPLGRVVQGKSSSACGQLVQAPHSLRRH